MGFFSNLFAKSGPRVDLDKRFHRLSEAGTGSMCKIYKARDLQIGKLVALKILDKERVAKLIAKDPVSQKRPAEGEIAAALKHPNVVATYDHGISMQGEPFLVMEFIEGVGLNYLVDSTGASLRGKRIDVLTQGAQGLAYFHRQNFIHRDICPRNIMVDNDGTIKLIDFGLAVPNIPEYRRPGNRTGSISHMAPELIRRMSTDQRIDIFSYGVTAYEVMTGYAPWDATDTLERARQHMNNAPKDPIELNPDMDDDLRQLLLDSLVKDPKERVPSMTEFSERLQALKRQDY